MSLVLQSSGGGSVTVQEPTTASNFTATLPAATGTVMVSGNMPAFSAYASGATTMGNNGFTKILFATEEFDTNNNFASSTFTPTVAGYYQVNSVVAASTSASAAIILTIIYKNGSRFKDGYALNSVNNTQGGWSGVSSLIYMNGSTDYLEIYVYQSGNASGIPSQTGANLTYFQASMVRAA
jgi:hypothetical protein